MLLQAMICLPFRLVMLHAWTPKSLFCDGWPFLRCFLGMAQKTEDIMTNISIGLLNNNFQCFVFPVKVIFYLPSLCLKEKKIWNKYFYNQVLNNNLLEDNSPSPPAIIVLKYDHR